MGPRIVGYDNLMNRKNNGEDGWRMR